ncbi:hypothetical protein BIW11_03900 [Tropilaelaps mercedesae]|uniref:Uncharacterized protein n=1 Tax=Tropilaelaps mercedesae TaxID=418985 RepID=A0A1V9XE70_9ACAR|nr:hypothetical protein BIW11_03900 [Tropilaelaps mercedesae]
MSVSGGKPAGGRRGVSGVRDHPYQRAV